MSFEGFSAERDGIRLRRAISLWCDGEISEQDLGWLQEVLVQSPAAREIYMDIMNIQSGVHAEVAGRQHVESVVREAFENPLLPLSKSADRDLKSRQRYLTRTSKLAWAVAAVLMLLAAVAWWPSRANNGADSSVALAHVVHETVGSEWSLDHNRNTRDKGIYSGSMVRVARGNIKLRFDNGTVLTLYAPALYEVVSEMRGRALLGKMTAKIAEGAEGYSVLTPRATVIDLGTELGIEVDGTGATDVVVFEGLVDLNYQPQHGSPAQQRLSSGEAMHLDTYGTVSRIVSISNHKFAVPGTVDEASSRPAIISLVRDNIQRTQGWNYYEIVHGGMREDARAFVDRTAHEWNGMDTSGMPKYLIGGDYVKTFNSDKCLRDIEIILTVDAPCKLYILFDDRIPPPGWLRKNFVQTGDKIGMDVGPWVYNNVASQGAEPGVGPGESIDNTMSVWVQNVEQAGPIHLGATETPHDDLNMYGIVAVPLQDSPASIQLD